MKWSIPHCIWCHLSLLQLSSGLIHTRSNLCQLDSWCMLDLICTSWIADTYQIYLAPARQLKKSGSNLCYISWKTHLYICRTPDTCWIKLASPGPWIHARQLILVRSGQLIHAGQLILVGSNLHQLDNWYMMDLTRISWTTDACWTIHTCQI